MFKYFGRVTLTIYIDILFCLNLIIDYMIILSVKHFLSVDAKRYRMIFGAITGGLSSFIILLPPMPSVVSWIINLLSACIIIAVSFCPLSRIKFIKTAATFFLISFCYCGLMIAIWMIFSPQNIVIRNSSVYIAVSPIVLIITTLFCYIVLRIILKITGRAVPKNINCKIHIKYKGMEKEIQGKIDTGNTLKEPFSGEYVIVVREELFKETINLNEYMNITKNNKIISDIRLIPFNSVGGTGLIPAIKPDSIKIFNNNNEMSVSAYIALCDNKNMTTDIQALVPAELVMKG